MFCSNCGTELNNNKFCNECGSRIKKQTNSFAGKGLGIASMIVSIVGAVLFGFFGIAPVVGIILGIVANYKSKNVGAKNKYAKAGIIIGAISLAIMVIAIIAFIALLILVPNLVNYWYVLQAFQLEAAKEAAMENQINSPFQYSPYPY